MAEGLQGIVSQVAPFLKGKASSASTPEPLKAWPHDFWPSQSDTGQWLLSGLVEYPAGFDAGVEAFWADRSCVERHTFAWLSDLKSMGGDVARQSARILVASWVDLYGSSKKRVKNYGSLSESAVTSRRILNILQSYDFHGATATESYQSLIGLIIYQDASFLYKKLSGRLTNVGGGKDYFLDSCALLNASLCLKDADDWADVGEKVLLDALDIQILSDGGHISRSPQTLADVLKICLDLRRLYQSINRPFPEDIQFHIDRMAQALKVFRYTDKRLGVFHGGQACDDKMLDLILHQTGQNKKIVKSLPKTGYERISQGRTVILMDVGGVPAAPFDRKAHLAPLAFELSHGKDRIIVNCGGHATNAVWSDALRRTSAHSSLTIDDRDAVLLHPDGSVAARAKEVISERTEHNNAILLEGMHDGYSSVFSGARDVRHVRRLYVSDKGQDVRGEDSVFLGEGLEKHIAGSIRFHLHPKVRVSLVRNGEAALLRLYSGVGWKFHCSGAVLSVEESVYMGESSVGASPAKTQQLVLTFPLEAGSLEKQVKWAFQREVA